MGDFRIVVEAMGGHGCQREVKDGGTVMGCERPGCPDCIAREMVRRLKRSGATVHSAKLVHWPADMELNGRLVGYAKENEVVDDLLTGERSGSF